MRRLQFAAYAAKGVQDSCWRQQNPLRVAMPGCQLHVPALTWQIRLVGVAAGCVGGPDLALGEAPQSEMVGQGSTPTPSEANVLYLRVRHRPIQPVPGEPRPCRLVAFEC